MDTKDGLTVLKAIELRFPETKGMASYPWEAWSSFQGLLREDSWYATGYRVSSVKPERILCNLWDILEIDLDSNTASSRVLEYEGLRFYEKKKVGKSLSLQPVRRADLKRFMENRIAELTEKGGRSAAREDEAAAREHFKDRSITRKWIEEIREKIVPPEWSTRGRRN